MTRQIPDYKLSTCHENRHQRYEAKITVFAMTKVAVTTVDDVSGAHVLSLKNAAGTEYAEIDKQGVFYANGNNKLLESLNGGSQSLTVTTVGTAVSTSVTFPAPFTTTYLVLPIVESVSVSTATYIAAQQGSVTSGGFTLFANSGVAQTVSIGWIVLGV